MVNAFFSYLYVAFIGLTSAFFFLTAFLIFLLTYPFDPRRVMLHQFSSFWASLYIWCMPLWSVRVKNRHKLDGEKHYVIVSNHQSLLDILVAFSLFFPFKWVSKAEVFKLPFIGWNMRLNQYVKLKRGNKESIHKMMADCRALLAKGCSVFLFPEGTRSETGLLKPFKTGAFILAKEAGVPILPIVINGTKNALPKKSLRFHGRHLIEIRVLDEIPHHVFKDTEVEEIAEMTREIIKAQVDEHNTAGAS